MRPALVIGTIFAVGGILVVAYALLQPTKRQHETSGPQHQQTNSSTPPSGGNEDQGQSGTKDQKEPSEKIKSGFRDWIVANEKWLNALSTGFIAIFTILLAAGTFALYRATQRLVEGADDTAERQLRAYLSVTGFHVTNLKAGEPIRAQIVLANSGKTPAYHVKYNISTMGIRAFPAPVYVPTELPPEPRVGGVTTAPNQGLFSISPYRAEPLLTQDEFNAIQPNENIMGNALYIRGVVTYIDAFNKMRKTRFYGAYGGRYKMNNIGAVAQMDQGNESD